jgi:hypothetical protein
MLRVAFVVPRTGIFLVAHYFSEEWQASFHYVAVVLADIQQEQFRRLSDCS